MPEIPIASSKTLTIVPRTSTRPGLIVVLPGNWPTSAGARHSSPTPTCPTRSFEARITPVQAVRKPEATKLPIT
jgi:hypothetical protein